MQVRLGLPLCHLRVGRCFATPRSTRPIVSDEWLFRLVTYVPGSLCNHAGRAFRFRHKFLVLEQPFRRGPYGFLIDNLLSMRRTFNSVMTYNFTARGHLAWFNKARLGVTIGGMTCHGDLPQWQVARTHGSLAPTDSCARNTE